MFKNIFVRLCNERNVAPTTVCKAVGLSNAAFTGWDENSVPRQATLMKIADYFGVTVDYLLGKEQKEKPADEADLDSVKVALFGGSEEVTDEMWDEVRNFAAYVKSKHKNDKNN